MNDDTQARVRLDSVPGPVKDLAELQMQHGLGDEAFVKQVGLIYHGSTWGKIKAGTFDGNQEKMLRAVRHSLTQSQGGLDPARAGYVLFPHIQTAFDAVEIAMHEADSDRLVIFAAGMGMGKSELCKQLRREMDAVLIEGRPSWGMSYLATLSDFAEALGVAIERHWGSAKIEKAVESALRETPRLLAVDEANYFTPEGLNFIKYLLNRTRAQVVLATLPVDYDRWTSSNRHESRQLVRRSVAILRAPNVSGKDVVSIAAAGWPGLHLGPASAAKIADAANKFGGLKLVTNVLRDTDPADADDLDRALNRQLVAWEKKA